MSPSLNRRLVAAVVASLAFPSTVRAANEPSHSSGPTVALSSPAGTMTTRRRTGKVKAAQAREHQRWRDQYLADAENIRAADGPQAKSDWLHMLAGLHGDPELHLDAADAALDLTPSSASLDRGATHLEAAEALLDDTTRAGWLDDSQIARLRGRDESLRERLDSSQTALSASEANERASEARRAAASRRVRRGRQELITGGALMAASFVGFGLLFGGLGQERHFGDLAASPSLAEYDTSPLQARQEDARTMAVVGAVSAGLFAAMGVPLLVLGAKDLKLGRKQREPRPTIAVQPGLGSFTLSLRF